MGKRILIISYYFGPQNAMGAVRPTKLAKYLTRMGHEVTVLCGVGTGGKEDPTLKRDMQGLQDVRILTEWNPLRARSQRKAAAGSAPAVKAQTTSVGQASLKRRVADAVYRFIRWCSDLDFGRQLKRELKRLDGPFDMVFSSYAPYSVHKAAQKAKKSGLAAYWVADFRDEVGLFFRWQDGMKERYMQMLRREADVLCSVSQGCLDMMGFGDIGRVLHNGFDVDDLGHLSAVEKDPSQMRVVYCGTIEMGRKNVPPRDLTPMFEALAQLIGQGELKREALKLVYAGGEGALFATYAQKCGLLDCVEDHGRVSREESLRLQSGADVLLMASWHTPEQKGILTGKLFEYMMMQKPIVCCMAGELPQSAVRRMMEETGIGLCCEQAAGEGGKRELLAYVRQLIHAWREGRPLTQNRNEAQVNRYAYANIARQLEGWMDQTDS